MTTLRKLHQQQQIPQQEQQFAVSVAVVVAVAALRPQLTTLAFALRTPFMATTTTTTILGKGQRTTLPPSVKSRVHTYRHSYPDTHTHTNAL